MKIADIRIDGGTQARERIDTATVSEYAEALRDGVEFPPVVVFFDGVDTWLADGFHRYHAHRQNGATHIEANIEAGTLDDAKLYAASANSDHGLRRTNEDKRRAVRMVLDAKPDWSDSHIAKHAGVSHTLVGQIRKSILQSLQDSSPTTRTVERNGTTYQQDTSRIGKNKPEEPEEPDEPEEAHELVEARDTIQHLAQENDTLRDRLAAEVMDASEEEKTLAVETIGELRAKVKTLEVELSAVKASRDGLMRENAEMKKQIAMQRKELDKLKR